MPKAKWGAGDEALTAADIDGAERGEVRQRYSGEVPPSGTYRFVIQSIKKAESGAGNPKAVIFATLDGSWRPNHKKYDGAPIWDHLPIMKSTAGRVGNFMDAVGGTGKDLIAGCVVDENGYVEKLGSVGDPKGLMVYITTKREDYEGSPQMKTGFNAYMMVDDEDEGADGASEADSDAGDDTEPPF